MLSYPRPQIVIRSNVSMFEGCWETGFYMCVLKTCVAMRNSRVSHMHGLLEVHTTPVASKM